MDEYQEEIAGIKRTLEKLRADEAAPDLIEEYAAELRNLVALYDAAGAAYVAGEEDERVRKALAILGFGDWSFDNVYAFVYDAAIAEDLADHELSSIVNQTDYAESLRAALEA